MEKVIHYHATMSSNSKTGKMLVTTSSENTCPSTCLHKQKGTCYAKFSFLGLHWRKVSAGQRSIGIEDVLRMVRGLPDKSLWRWGQAGDLPGIGNDIDATTLVSIINANNGKRGYAYTHKPLDIEGNFECISAANALGFTINYSCDTMQQVVETREKYKHIPLVVTLPDNAPKSPFNINGIDFVPCPEQVGLLSSCTECGICAVPTRKSVIVFYAHGSRKKKWDTTKTS